MIERAPPPNGLGDDAIAAIRAVLAAGGVAEHRLDWMSRSCPSIERAIAYVTELSSPTVHP